MVGKKIATKDDLEALARKIQGGGIAGGGGSITSPYDNPEANVDDYSSLEVAISTIGTTETGVIIPSAESIVNDTTIPANISTRIPQGGEISVASGKTLTINGAFEAGLYQIFSGSGTVIFGANSVSAVCPEWWGIDGAADDVQIAQAIAAAVNVKKVKLQGKIYTIVAGILINLEKLKLVCDAGTAELETVNDINGITISVDDIETENISVKTTHASSTKAGWKWTAGIIRNGHHKKPQSYGFAYSFELYASSGSYIAYNEFYHPISNSKLLDFYIHEDAGVGYANENTIFGGNLHAIGGTGENVVMYGNNNKFIGTSFEGTHAYDFMVKDFGQNYIMGCRFENPNSYGIYIQNASGDPANSSRVIQNFWACKKPYITCKTGIVRVQDDVFTGIIFGDNAPIRVSTDVDQSSSGTILYVTSVLATPGDFYVGDNFIVNEGGAHEEWLCVYAVGADYVTTTETMRYTHGIAETVRCYERKFGMDKTAYNALNFYSYGTKCQTLGPGQAIWTDYIDQSVKTIANPAFSGNKIYINTGSPDIGVTIKVPSDASWAFRFGFMNNARDTFLGGLCGYGAAGNILSSLCLGPAYNNWWLYLDGSIASIKAGSFGSVYWDTDTILRTVYKNSGGDVVSHKSIGYTHGFWTSASTPAAATRKMFLDQYGRLFAGGATDPTAWLHLAPGVATAGYAPLKLTAGTNLTLPEAGAVEFDGTNLFYTDSGAVRRTLGIAGGAPAAHDIISAHTASGLTIGHFLKALTTTTFGFVAHALEQADISGLTTANTPQFTGLNLHGGGVNGDIGYCAHIFMGDTTIAHDVAHISGPVRATHFEVGVDTQVVGARGAAVADATDAATAITQLNALLARCRTHGLIAAA